MGADAARPKRLGTVDTSSDHLRSVIDIAAPVILQMDRDGMLTFAAGYHLGALGLSTRSMIGSRFGDFFDHGAQCTTLLNEALIGEYGVTEVSLGGAEFEVRVMPLTTETGEIVGATAVFSDITERARTTQELRRSEASFRMLIESSPDAVIVHRFSRIVYANAATTRLLRTPELKGRPVLELFPRDERGNIAERIRKASHENESSTERFKLVRGDGELGTFEITTMSLLFDGAEAIVHIARDITQTLLMQTKLAQTERLASLGTLAGGVGHEINNPLAYMTANLSFIADELGILLPAEQSEDNADLHSALQDVRDGTDRVRDIVRQLSEFTKVDADTEEFIDARVCLENAVRMSWNHLRRRARVNAELFPVALVRGNQARLGQVFLAILLNATEALREATVSSSEIRLRSYEQDDFVVLEVADNGKGMPDEILANIFDPFFSGNASGQATGLGLSVAHSIVSSMDGTIDVSTSLGVGTTVSIRLPKAREGSSGPSAPRHVLVVTDEVRFLEAAQVALRGHHVRIAGRMSIAGPELEADHFDAIVCDLSSADVSINKFGERASNIADTLVFVAQTGTAITDEEAAYANTILRKPVGADTLAMQLNALWSSPAS